MDKPKFRRITPFILLALVAVIAVFVKSDALWDFTNKVKTDGTPHYTYNSGDTAWMLVSCAFVFIMTPALAFFYGGMIGRGNVLSTMVKSTVSAGIISILWVVVLFSLCFGESIGGFIGDPNSFFFFRNVMSGEPWAAASTIPLSLFAFYQLMYAIITPGLVVGAVAERIRFTSYTLFILLFGILVYAPLAHMTWHPNGLMAKWGVQDFAGGTVVHISAGMAALAGAMVLKRKEHRTISAPANVSYVLIGSGLLWFGWFGFNGGSAFGANPTAVQALGVTNIAAASAGLAWMFLDVFKGKKPSVLGFCIGAVVGLVAITPAAGFVALPQAIFIGFIASIISNFVVELLKRKTQLDEPLDIFACHGVGGIAGMLLTGLFTTMPPGETGLFNNQFLIQLTGMLFAVAYSFTVSTIIFKAINFIIPMRISLEESDVMDAADHNEEYLQDITTSTTNTTDR